MHIQIYVTSGLQNDNDIHFLVEDFQLNQALIPAGKMITDSEKLTFVYLVDQEEEYGHIHFPQPVWPFMLEAIKLGKDPTFIYGDRKMQLTGFIDDLNMLIFNIEGNDNYGEVFSSAVEQAFAEILTSTE